MKKLKLFSILFFGYAILTIIMTYPVVFRFSSHFMCDGGDGFQNVWNMWWMKKSLMAGTHPYYTNLLHYPDGITLLFQTLNPFNGLISIPFQFFFKMEEVYNLVVLFSFVMSGVSMYYLVDYLLDRKLPAFVAGIVFTFCPFHFAHGLGHLQLIAMEWIPLYVLYLLKTYQEDRKINAILTALFWVLNSLCSWYYMIYCFVFTVIFVIFYMIKCGRKIIDNGFLKRLGMAILIFSVVMSPILMPMLYTKITQDFTGEHNPEIWSADLESFFVPSGISTWGRRWFSGIWKDWTGNTAENSNYLGYIVLILSVYAVIKDRRCHLWAVAGFIFFVMALGPYLHVGGKQFSIPLPYLLFHRYIPFIAFTGVPERFDIMLKLCMSVLVGYGIINLNEIILSAFKNQMRSRSITTMRRGATTVKIVFNGILALLIGLEYLAIPYVTTKIEVPSFYRQMAKDTEHYGVIDIPSRSVTLYMATIHQKSLVGGYVSRPSLKALSFLDQTPIISTLMRGKPAPPSKLAQTLATSVFADFNIRYIITHNDQHLQFLEDILQLPVVHRADGITVYDCH